MPVAYRVNKQVVDDALVKVQGHMNQAIDKVKAQIPRAGKAEDGQPPSRTSRMPTHPRASPHAKYNLPMMLSRVILHPPPRHARPPIRVPLVRPCCFLVSGVQNGDLTLAHHGGTGKKNS